MPAGGTLTTGKSLLARARGDAAMKRACLGYAAFFLLAAVLGGAVLVWLLPPSPPGNETPLIAKLVWAQVAGMGWSFFVTVAAGVLKDTGVRLRDRARLAAGFATTLPREGEKIVACGALVADGPLLTAPFSATPCAIYWYQVKHTSGGSHSTDVIDAWGYALTPSRVESSWGAVRLASYTELDFPPSVLSDPAAKARARAYLNGTALVPIGLGALGESIAAVGTLMADEDGSVRGDFGALPPKLEEARYSLCEKVVVDGARVCAFGHYAEDRRALLPDPSSRTLDPVMIVKGTAELVRRRLLVQAIANACFAAVLLGIAGAIVWAFFHYAPVYL
jgi:hypothetical protein